MTISILGCGWLGFPLALHLLSKGYQVKGSTTSKEKLDLLESNGIKPFMVQISNQIENNCGEFFWDSDVLFLNIPPGRSSSDVLDRYPGQIQKVAERVEESPIDWVIFASSTSVYSKHGGLVTENDADPETASSDSGKALLECEKQIMNHDGFDSTVIRFGGLYGYDRHPVKFFAGKKNISQANKPINFIHQDDCINIISGIIEQGIKNEIFNAVSDGHPPRREFYESAAIHFGLEKPEFKADHEKDYRIVSNKKLKKSLNYSFIYPNPMDHTP